MALAPIAITLALLAYHIFVNGGGPHVPLFLGVFVASLFGVARGHRWLDIQSGIVDSIALAVPVIGIFFVVGMTIGTWILSGTVPYLTLIGLEFLSPNLFLPITCIVCALVSVFTGTSWGTVGTFGLALLAIGEGVGMPIYWTAGAIVSGAWFGDKMSPLSDTTNFAAAIVEANLYAHIRTMLPTTVPSMVIALVVYWFVGSRFVTGVVDNDMLDLYAVGLNDTFVLNAAVLIPPVVIGITIYRKLPPLPGIFMGVLAAGVIAFTAQHASVGEILDAMMNGYVSNTGNEQLDRLLTKGGMISMMWVVSLIMIAMALGGVLQKTQCLTVIVRAILERVSGRAGIISAALLSVFGFNLTSNAFIAYSIPGRMFAPAFRRLALAPTNLSRALEDGATMTAPLIPWNTGGVYVSQTLGVPTLLYAPFAIANWLAPVFDLLWAWTGLFVPARSPADD